MICITFDNGSNNTVGGGCYSAHQALSRFEEHHIDMINCIRLKCQSWDGVSGDINKPFECITITDSKFSNRILVCMMPKSTSINWVTIWTWTIWFLPPLVQMRTSWPLYCRLHFACWIVFQYLYHLDSLQSWCVLGNDTCLQS